MTAFFPQARSDQRRAPVETLSAISSITSRTPVSSTTTSSNIPQQPADQIDSWLSVEAQAKRHEGLGLSQPKAARFIENCACISLGSYCAVARALQSVGLKDFTYPFDWVRCPSRGVIQCLDTQFQDFLTYSMTIEQEQNDGKAYGGSKWGGSFWHHDPSATQTRNDMARRIDRFWGFAEVPASRARVFVRAANSSAELEDCVELHDALCRALPKARVYLLVLVDLQCMSGPLGITGHEDLLCWRVHERICPVGGNWSMQRQAEAYAEALAFSIRLWAGEEGLASHVKMVPDLKTLSCFCDAFEGTDPASELWLPKRIQGSMSRTDLSGSPPSGNICGESLSQSPNEHVSPRPIADNIIDLQGAHHSSWSSAQLQSGLRTPQQLWVSFEIFKPSAKQGRSVSVDAAGAHPNISHTPQKATSGSLLNFSAPSCRDGHAWAGSACAMQGSPSLIAGSVRCPVKAGSVPTAYPGLLGRTGRKQQPLHSKGWLQHMPVNSQPMQHGQAQSINSMLTSAR